MRVRHPEKPSGQPTLVWLGGYRSDMTGTKAVEVERYAMERGAACVRFDYSGHGASGGAFTDGTISRWLEEFRMDNELLYSLEDAMFGAYDGDDYGPVVDEWIADNRDWVDGLTR